VFRDVQDGPDKSNRLTLLVAFHDLSLAEDPLPVTGFASGSAPHIQILKPSRIAIIK